jgi:hypothetical protein
VRSVKIMQWLKYIIIPKSGVMKTQLEVLVTHENITIQNDFVDMDSKMNYIEDPCGYILNSFSWP